MLGQLDLAESTHLISPIINKSFHFSVQADTNHTMYTEPDFVAVLFKYDYRYVYSISLCSPRKTTVREKRQGVKTFLLTYFSIATFRADPPQAATCKGVALSSLESLFTALTGALYSFTKMLIKAVLKNENEGDNLMSC